MGRSLRKRLLFILEILILIFFIGGLYLYGQVNAKLEKIQQPVLEEEEIAVNPEVRESGLTGYTTYALFGIDRRNHNEDLEGENSDTIIIASVNNDTGEVKLVSVFRDTVLDVGGGTYSKANSAYGSGGPEKAISMLNTNLDLDIRDYVTVDFNALTTVVDMLGGLDIPLSYAEIDHMNHYCVETSRETGKSYTPVELPEETPQTPEELEAIIGTYHLNGVQVTSYCRIRYTASMDMGRTARQRNVISMLVNKAKRAGLTTIFQIMDEVFPMVQTSLNQTEILKMIPAVIGYRLGATTGFPIDYTFTDMYVGGTKYSIIAPVSLKNNVTDLHKFLYGDNTPYVVSAQVDATSARIDEIIANNGQELSITQTAEEELYEDDEYETYSYEYDSDQDDSYSYGDDPYGGDSGYYGGGEDDDYGGDGDYSDGSGDYSDGNDAGGYGDTGGYTDTGGDTGGYGDAGEGTGGYADTGGDTGSYGEGGAEGGYYGYEADAYESGYGAEGE